MSAPMNARETRWGAWRTWRASLLATVLPRSLRARLMVFLLGAVLVLACDIIGRLIRYPFEIPVATVFGVLGTVLFLVLLMKRSGHAV